MQATHPIKPAIVCEITAVQEETSAAIADIAKVCAQDMGQPLLVKTGAAPRISALRRATRESVLTFHLPAALAAAQHPIWCLACRLACFCPNVRVSVLVQAEASFTPAKSRRRRRIFPSSRAVPLPERH